MTTNFWWEQVEGLRAVYQHGGSSWGGTANQALEFGQVEFEIATRKPNGDVTDHRI